MTDQQCFEEDLLYGGLDIKVMTVETGVPMGHLTHCLYMSDRIDSYPLSTTVYKRPCTKNCLTGMLKVLLKDRQYEALKIFNRGKEVPVPDVFASSDFYQPQERMLLYIQEHTENMSTDRLRNLVTLLMNREL